MPTTHLVAPMLAHGGLFYFGAHMGLHAVEQQLRTGVKAVGKEKDPREKAGHMALRNNVQDLKLDLWHEVKPLEYYLIEIIIDKTIKWRSKMAKISIEELTERTRQRHDYIYIALKNLEKKGIIIRRKVKHDWFIGLNEEYFGGLLIKRHEESLQERKKKIKIVVDNSKNPTQNQSESDSNLGNSRLPESQDHTENESEKETEHIETIGEMRTLNTLLKDISIKTSLKESADAQTGTEESFTLSRGKGSGPGSNELTEEQCESGKARWRKQLEELEQSLKTNQEKMKA